MARRLLAERLGGGGDGLGRSAPAGVEAKAGQRLGDLTAGQAALEPPTHANTDYAPAEPAGSNGRKLDLYIPAGPSTKRLIAQSIAFIYADGSTAPSGEFEMLAAGVGVDETRACSIVNSPTRPIARSVSNRGGHSAGPADSRSAGGSRFRCNQSIQARRSSVGR